ncbi:MAG TPA: DUF885 family protein [Chthoniobacterales bacterium]|nr:DUF885 family protein [Chthoniobacterales bacterium]
MMAQPTPAPQPPGSSYEQLASLFTDWRAFNHPAMDKGRPDYSAVAMTKKAKGLADFRARLKSIDPSGWSTMQKNDYRVVEAEMNGLDFFLRILKPWQRDPDFYATVFPEMSDVPAHEGPSAEPNIDLFAYQFPLSPADDARLAELLGAIPALLADARINLAGSTAHDLWAYGDRAFADQADALAQWQKGDLEVRDLGGARKISLDGASPALKAAVEKARVASTDFAAWVKAEAPKRQGPSGVGKTNYDWWLQHVMLSPLTYDQQIVLLQCELDRSLASLRLEEARNRDKPPITPIDDPAAYAAMSRAHAEKLYRLWVDTGTIADKPYAHDALLAQAPTYVPLAERNFFSHVTALDPLPLSSHEFHWIELARLANETQPTPIRSQRPLFNMYADRSEGFATAMEEIAMQEGVYDDEPHGRELVWIMLANRAARGLASLRVQSNEMTLDEAGKFHAGWTPRGWSDPKSKLVGFEQLLYLRQPGYGPSYIVGKSQLDKMIARASHQAEASGKPFNLQQTFAAICASGIVPPSIIDSEFFERLR